jgi:hypothetical protein
MFYRGLLSGNPAARIHGSGYGSVDPEYRFKVVHIYHALTRYRIALSPLSFTVSCKAQKHFLSVIIQPIFSLRSHLKS